MDTSANRVHPRLPARSQMDSVHGSPLLHGQASSLSPKRSHVNWLFIFMLTCVSTSILTIFYVLIQITSLHQILTLSKPYINDASVFAFGSNLLHSENTMDVWHHVMEANPDVWIWAGNFASLDENISSCNSPSMAHTEHCLCLRALLPSSHCPSLDPQKVIQTFQSALRENTYSQFLQHMCSSQETTGYPVDGVSCEHPIIGIYGSNEFLPVLDKYMTKNIFLDAIGETQASPRRSTLYGVEKKYIFNNRNTLKEISFFLLDDHYYRDPISCATLQTFCDAILKKDISTHELAANWHDFCISKVNATKCCEVDTFLWGEEGLCKMSAEDATLTALHVGYFVFILNTLTWLFDELSKSKSRINFIVSSLPLFENSSTPCSAASKFFDNSWECHHAAQQNFLSIIGRAGASCVILLSGSSSFEAKIKKFSPSSDALYFGYSTVDFSIPIYQLISGGLNQMEISSSNEESSASTTKKCPSNSFCVSNEPTFGIIRINWISHEVTLQIIYSRNGTMASEMIINIHECSRQV
ncbi:hypothetical protein IE077_002733 [Cardiosporidium cionae]|uniref:Uncharacterized protein n=1 Tax=Cardiosporidium cionae TaxID=476202 RepID=A0ABQ7JA54_9APIC|nr:hypothetical protein IE077_002733 [Cardiosporidium cionae]|eukprot:KAF8820861.1 hypothetical protein IE077_002733 [Cardiosporidium cionae]